MTLLTDAASIAALAIATPNIDINPGDGGSVGLPGIPGEGGRGGPPGSADCEPWCDERPNRVGQNGTHGNSGALGDPGDRGPPPPADAIQVLPITEQEWLDEFNRPHILHLSTYAVEPGTPVEITGTNFDPAAHRVYFDGQNIGPISNTESATFTVPLDAEGGSHPVVVVDPIKPTRRSNRAMLQILPELDSLAPKMRWVENQTVTITGRAFRPGVVVLAEDRSVSPANSFVLPQIGSTRTSIQLKIPGGFLGGLRGVRRLFARNPDGGRSRFQDHVVRIGDTIVVKCAAFRVIGTSPGVGTSRSAADIANLFAEGAVNSLSTIWAQARIAFRLVQPVKTISIRDDWATTWPQNSENEKKTFRDAPAVSGALNLFFVRDVETSSVGYAFVGGGPLFIGEDGGDLLSPGAFNFEVAHEIGHALCLNHICSKGGETGTFFGRDCNDGDKGFLMYPTNAATGAVLDAGQIGPSRMGATHFEDGKISALPEGSLFGASMTQCTLEDEDD